MATFLKFLLYGFGGVFLILGIAITGFWKPLYHHLLASVRILFDLDFIELYIRLVNNTLRNGYTNVFDFLKVSNNSLNYVTEPSDQLTYDSRKIQCTRNSDGETREQSNNRFEYLQ